MEKAILKTIIYADIFDYPLKAVEIHKWLIGEKAIFQQIEKALERLNQKSKVKNQKDYFFLPNRGGLVRKRQIREKQSKRFLLKAKFSAWFLKIIPWVKLVGISGGLALNNADKKDDIDLFIITAKNRLWLSRILVIFILDFLRIRRKAKMNGKQAAGKLCVNILMEEDKLEQSSKDIYVAHEVLQMKILWQRDGIYSKYLADNGWVFKFLPNWITSERLMIKDLRLKKDHKSLIVNHKSTLDYIENIAKWFQLRIMIKPKGMERIEDGALYFHPNDIRPQVLKAFSSTP